jgi:hypothetical protein
VFVSMSKSDDYDLEARCLCVVWVRVETFWSSVILTRSP